MIKQIILEDSLHAIRLIYPDDGRFHHVDFTIHQIGLCDDGTVEYINESAGCQPDFKTDPTQAMPLAEGSLKWDGCIDFRFPGQESRMLHFCSAKSFENLNGTFQELYRAVREIMPAADF
jgi:hypothetical protein